MLDYILLIFYNLIKFCEGNALNIYGRVSSPCEAGQSGTRADTFYYPPFNKFIVKQ